MRYGALKDIFTSKLVSPQHLFPFVGTVFVIGAIVSSVVLGVKNCRMNWKRLFLEPANSKTRKLLITGIAMSCATSAAFVCIVHALSEVSPFTLSLIDNSFYPIIVAALAAKFLGEELDNTNLYGIGISVLGIIVFLWRDVVAIERSDLFFAASGVPVFFGIAIVLAKQMLADGASTEYVVFMRFTPAAACFLIIQLLFFHPIRLILDLDILLLACFGFVLPFFISFYALKKCPRTFLVWS